MVEPCLTYEKWCLKPMKPTNIGQKWWFEIICGLTVEPWLKHRKASLNTIDLSGLIKFGCWFMVLCGDLPIKKCA